MPFPNPDTQFKPGNPGGPGIPKGYKHISTWIQEMMNDDEFEARLLDPKGGFIDFKGPALQAIIMTARHKASNGDEKAREWLAKYGWGTKLDLTTGGKPMPAPIFGGTANLPADDSVQEDSEPTQAT